MKEDGTFILQYISVITMIDFKIMEYILPQRKLKYYEEYLETSNERSKKLNWSTKYKLFLNNL